MKLLQCIAIAYFGIITTAHAQPPSQNTILPTPREVFLSAIKKIQEKNKTSQAVDVVGLQEKVKIYHRDLTRLNWIAVRLPESHPDGRRTRTNGRVIPLYATETTEVVTGESVDGIEMPISNNLAVTFAELSRTIAAFAISMETPTKIIVNAAEPMGSAMRRQLLMDTGGRVAIVMQAPGPNSPSIIFGIDHQ